MTQKIPSERELELLRLVSQERTGREVAAAYLEQTGRTLPYGTIYTLFNQMEGRGWVRSRTSDRDLRIRRVTITEAGLAALRAAQRHYAYLAHLASRAQSAKLEGC